MNVIPLIVTMCVFVLTAFREAAKLVKVTNAAKSSSGATAANFVLRRMVFVICDPPVSTCYF